MLCACCLAIFSHHCDVCELVFYNKCPPEDHVRPHHPTLESLKNAVLGGCQCCIYVFGRQFLSQATGKLVNDDDIQEPLTTYYVHRSDFAEGKVYRPRTLLLPSIPSRYFVTFNSSLILHESSRVEMATSMSAYSEVDNICMITK